MIKYNFLSLQTVFSPTDLRIIIDWLGQKRRAFEPLCLSLPYGFLDTQPDPIHIADVRMLSNFYNDL
jgi:hypothetical protein